MPGNQLSCMNYPANTYHFRQDSNFLYYAGLDVPGMAVILDADTGKSYLFGRELSMEDIVWEGNQPSLPEHAARAGLDEALPVAQLAPMLGKAMQTGRSIHYCPVYRPENLIWFQELLGIPLKAVNRRTSTALIRAIVAQRSVKQPEEIPELHKALNTTRQMHLAVMQQARAGMTEARLAGTAHGIAVGEGGELAYPIILTVNGQTLHNHYHGNTLRSGQLVLIDAGAETAMHYAGDMTRTFPVNATFSTRQREIYDIVLQAEVSAARMLRPGIPYRDVHLASARIIASGLRELGLMKGDVEEAVAAGAHALFFPHGLGHALGLDVHDMENLGENFVGYDEEIQRSNQFGLSALRLGRRLQQGFVLTVEPGIYFIPELIDLWQAEKRHAAFINYPALAPYRDFGGIRIEENFLITAEGAQLLGEPLAKTATDIEAIRQGAA